MVNDAPILYREDKASEKKYGKNILLDALEKTPCIYTYLSPFRKRAGVRPNGDIADLGG